MRLKLTGLLSGILLFTFLSEIPRALGEVSLPPDAAALADEILDGVKFNRESIRSGIFRCRGTWQHVNSGTTNADSGDVTIYCAFDILKNQLRFDREQPYQIGVRPNEINTIATKFIRTSDDTKYWRKDYGHMAEVYAPDWTPDFLGIPFDVRILGLAYWGDFVMAAQFDKLLEFYRSDPPIEVSEEENSLIRVTWVYGNNRNSKRTIWINKQEGYTPIRLEISDRYGEVKDPSKWPSPCIVSDASWKQHDGVWVPASYQIKYVPPRGEGASTRYELVFDWEAVNTDLDEKLFTLAGLELPAATVVIDHRLGTPLIVEKIGYPQMHQETRQSKWNPTRIALVSINVILIFAIGIALWIRNKRQRGISFS